MAIMAAGCVTVPAYTTNTIEDHRHILANSGVRAVIVSTEALAHRVMPAADQISRIDNIIMMETLVRGQLSHAEIHSWEAVLNRGAAEPDDITERIGGIGREDTACLIYTSGTGGVPKGVMLSHKNILANCRG